MKIGIPKALLYYKYHNLWKYFFEYLDIDLVYSPNTNKRILKRGIKYAIDESCLSSKIFLGHVDYLKKRCDYVLVPRVASIIKKEELCTKFYALPDIVANTFDDINILTYDIDVSKGKSEKKAFLSLGKELGFKNSEVEKAYKYAKEEEFIENIRELEKQHELLEQDGIKVLIVSHVYNTYDDFVGKPVLDYLKELGVIPIIASTVSKKEALKRSKKLSKRLYWTYNKELLGGIDIYKDYVDGIIMISSFPCGPDSLVNDLVIRKIKDIPITNLVIDELSSLAGLHTRLESFVDILKYKKEDEL